jgi:hypothetical protein
MILHKKNKSPFYKIIVPLFIIIILIIPKEKSYYTNLKVSLMDKISTYDLGFSQLYGIFDGNDFFSLSKSLSFSKAPKIVLNSLIGVERDKIIPKINIDINFKNYKKILQDRDSAMSIRLGSNFREVTGYVSADGRKMKAKIRLKGDLIDHWGSKYRMSLRVKLKNDNSLFGFSEFSIQKSQTRMFPYDQSFQDIQRKMGNISSVHDYVDITINGQNWGIMNIEEHITKELLEKQKLKESLIFKIGDQQDWLYWYTNEEKDTYKNYLLSDPYLYVDVYKRKKYMSEKIYRKWYSYVSKEHLKKQNNIYDNDSFSTSLIFSFLWNNNHTLLHNNSKYYFNPYDLKLHPITTDQSVFSSFNEGFNLPKPFEKLVNNPLFKSKFEQNLNKVKKEIINSDSIFHKWSMYFPLDNKIDSDILIKNSNLIKDFKDFKDYIITDEVKTDSLTESKAKNLFDQIHARHFDNGQIHIYNLLNEKINLKRIFLEGKVYKNFEKKYIDSHQYKYKPLIIQTDLIGIYDSLIEIETDYLNSKRKFRINFTHQTENLNNPLLDNLNLKGLNFLEEIDDQNIKIKKGLWHINQPIVVKKNLLIEAGTKLVFNENSYLIVNGGSLKILGSEKENVILTSKKGFWKGFYVINSPNKSFLKNVSISNVTFLRDGILDLTGAITFYRSDVDFLNVKFLNSIAEDFLNLVHSNFSLDNVTIKNAISDGLDSDFSVGKIKNSNFQNIKGDAIDFSGSIVDVDNTIFKKIVDKAISVGEASKIQLNSILADSVGVGIASKDGSFVELKNSVFSNFQLKAIMTYQKKSFYKTSTLIGNDILIDDFSNCCHRQFGTKMILEDRYISEKYLNVDSLYQTVIMKK